MSETEFKDIHDAFRPRIRRYLARLVGESEAEDLTQSVMLKVSDALPGFRGEASVSTWIYRIATNAALDRLRVPVREQSVADVDEVEASADLQVSSAEDTAVRAEMSACIREFVHRLPEHYRAPMLLGEIEGFSDREIAAILGISVGAVKIRLHRGRAKLLEALREGCSFQRDSHGLACDRRSD